MDNKKLEFIEESFSREDREIQIEIAQVFIKHNLGFQEGILSLLKMTGFILDAEPTAPEQIEMEFEDYVLLITKDKSVLPNLHRERERHNPTGKTKH